jgi:hypothetical protein
VRALRNCNLTTVAPTGTISIFAGCSGGIEPLFAVAFMRNQAGVKMPDVNPDFVRMAREGADLPPFAHARELGDRESPRVTATRLVIRTGPCLFELVRSGEDNNASFM